MINNPDVISAESPAELEDDNTALLSVYLYRVGEDPFLKNQVSVPGLGGQLRKPPLALELSYLITPLLRAPRECQIVLGKIMQILYDHPTLEGADLAGSLNENDPPLRVNLYSSMPDEIARIWSSLGTKHKLSVSYTVRVSMLDSTRERQTRRVLDRDTTYAGKSARQPVEI